MTPSIRCDPCWKETLRSIDAATAGFDQNPDLIEDVTNQFASQQLHSVSGKAGSAISGQKTGYCNQHFDSIATSDQATADALTNEWAKNFRGTDLRTATQSAIAHAIKPSKWSTLLRGASETHELLLAHELWSKNQSLAQETWKGLGAVAAARAIPSGLQIGYRPMNLGPVECKFTELAMREVAAAVTASGEWADETVSAMKPRVWLDQGSLRQECLAVHGWDMTGESYGQ